MRKKSYIISGVIIPVFIIIFFSFEFGGQYKYKIGIVDKDNSYSSNQIIESIDELEDIQSVKIKEKDYKLLLITQQIEVAVIIDKNFEENLLNFKPQEINIKSIKYDAKINPVLLILVMTNMNYLPAFGLFAPYLERACFLLATPAVSSVPRMI